jgi:hypothetical protein
MAGAGNLGTHAEALQVVVASLWRDMLPAGLLGDPLCNAGTSPQAATRCWSLHRGCQVLQLLMREEGTGAGSTQLAATIPEGSWSLPVVALDHAAGIVVVQTNQRGRLFDGHPVVGNEGQELPATGLHRGGGLARPAGELRSRNVGMQGEATCHSAA